MQAIYGTKAATLLGSADPAEVRQVWAEELGQFSGEDLRSAMEVMRTVDRYKEFPPTVFQFADLCRDAKRRREQGSLKLEDKSRTEMPARIRAQIDAFRAKHVIR